VVEALVRDVNQAVATASFFVGAQVCAHVRLFDVIADNDERILERRGARVDASAVLNRQLA
jgi:hypothetical protein